MTETFNALVVREAEEGNPKTASAAIEQLTDADLPDYDAGDVVVQVDYSSLNYKDGMALTGKGRIIRSYPMVPGIDFSGTVISSESPKFASGDEVILTGWSVGERYWGGYSQRQKVKAMWLNRRPLGMSAVQAMGIGTAGLTAMLCVMGLEDGGVKPTDGPIVVTGAAGGVGSVATLWGDSPGGARLPIDEVAAAAGTIGYELMCALAPRVPASALIGGLLAALTADTVVALLHQA